MSHFKDSLFLMLALLGLALPSFADPTPPVSLSAPAAVVRTNTGVTVTLGPEVDLQPQWSYRWSATLGAVQGNGASAQFTAGTAPGYAVVSVDISDGDTLVATRHLPLLVFKQFIIIKADDLVSYDDSWPDTWRQYLAFMSEERRIKHSVGLITNSLQTAALNEATDYTANIRAQDDSGLVEIWHHGYDHTGDPSGSPGAGDGLVWNAPMRAASIAEFFGRDYAYQKNHLDTGLAWSRERLNIPIHTFGAPFGLSDSVTLQVVEESADVQVWFDGQQGTTRRLLDVDELLVENPTGYPSLDQFNPGYSASPPLLILQVHPGYTEPDTSHPFIERFNAWVEIIDTLQSKKVTFIVPYEYDQLYKNKVLPLSPAVDSDGDGASDMEEGGADEDGDGLPDFLDPLSDGVAGLRVRNVQLELSGPGQYDITYELLGKPTDVADLTVELRYADGNSTTLNEITGGTAGVTPSEGLTLQWDAAAEFPNQDFDGARIVITPRTDTPPTPPMVEVGEGTFTQGCPNCGSGDSFPRFDVSLDAYAIGEFEITCAEFAAALNYALGQGYLLNVSGASYAGGDVYLGGQMLIDILSSESPIAFSAGQFAVKSKNGHPLDGYPVTHVTWYGAVAFCNWQSELQGLTPAYELGGHWALHYPYTNGYRLPTEAEWERAAAWDGSAALVYGYGSSLLESTRGNFGSGNPIGFTSPPYLTPAGYYDGDNGTQLSMSPVGAADMSGNAAEWVQDRFGPYAGRDAPLHNPRGLDTRPKRVVRGGGWNDGGAGIEAAAREARFANHASYRVGFRVARSLQSGTGLSAPFGIDTVAPVLQGIELDGAPGADAESLGYSITFSEAVSGFDESLISLVTTGEVETAPTITAFSGAGSSYHITVDTGYMTGDLVVKVEDASGLVVDEGENPISPATFESGAFSVDTLAPRPLSLTRVGNPARNAATIDFDLVLSKPVVGVSPEDFAVDTTGNVVTGPEVVGVSGAGDSWRVTVGTGAMEGTIALRLADEDASIQDAAGRPLTGGISSSSVHTADTVRPVLASITLQGSPAGNASLVNFSIQFSEPVSGFKKSNLSLSAEGTVTSAPSLTTLTGSGADYSIGVLTGTMDGTITLALANTTGVSDAAGNPLETGSVSGQVHIDKIAPQFVSIALQGSPAANAATLEYAAVFSEPVQGVTEQDFQALSVGTVDTAPQVVSVVAGAGGEYGVQVSTGAVEGGIALRLAPSGVKDLAGNGLPGGSHDTSLHPTDTRSPRLLSVEAITASPTAADAVQFRLVFSEPVAGLNGDGDANLTVSATGGLTFADAETVFEGNLNTFLVTLSGLSQSSGAITLAPRPGSGEGAGDIVDQNGNALVPITAEPASIAVDRTPPELDCIAVFADLDASGAASVEPAGFDDGSTDDSGGPVTAVSVAPSTFDCNSLGLQNVVVEFADGLGNTATCNSYVIVRDPLEACVVPEGEGEGIVEGEGVADGEGAVEGEGAQEGIAEGEGVAEGEGSVDGEGVPEGEGEGEGINEGEGEGTAPAYSGDWHGGADGMLDFTELLRVIQLYNAGGFCCGEGDVEDGFAPGVCDTASCARHSADYEEPVWDISLSELLRVLQLFNLGGFAPCADGESEDGFCPLAP